MSLAGVGGKVELGGRWWKVESLLGQGAFARAYKLGSGEEMSVMKVQKPACPWEAFVLEELAARLAASGLTAKLAGAVMSVDAAFFFDDGSCLLNAFSPHGTLLVHASISLSCSEY